MDDNLTKILLAVVGILAVGGTFFVIKIRKNKSNNNVQQNNNNVTNGDIVGGDKNTHK